MDMPSISTESSRCAALPPGYGQDRGRCVALLTRVKRAATWIGVRLTLMVLPALGHARNDKSHYLDEFDRFGVPRPSDLPGDFGDVPVGDALLVTLGGAFVFGFLAVSCLRMSRMLGLGFLCASLIGVALMSHFGLSSFQVSDLVQSDGDFVAVVNGTGARLLAFFTSNLVGFAACVVGMLVAVQSPPTSSSP